MFSPSTPYAQAGWVALIYALGIVVVNQIPIYGQERAVASFFAGAIGFVTVGGTLTLARRFLRPRTHQAVTSECSGVSPPVFRACPCANHNQPKLLLATDPSLGFLSAGSLSTGSSLLLSRPFFLFSSPPLFSPLPELAGRHGEGSFSLVDERRVGQGNRSGNAASAHPPHAWHVQNKVLALRLSDDSDSLKDLQGLKAAISEIIAEAKEDFQGHQTQSFDQKIHKLTEDWQPVATITVASALPDMSPLRGAVLFMVIQEAVTNSIRHGLSRTVSVDLRPGDSPRRVSLRDS